MKSGSRTKKINKLVSQIPYEDATKAYEHILSTIFSVHKSSFEYIQYGNYFDIIMHKCCGLPSDDIFLLRKLVTGAFMQETKEYPVIDVDIDVCNNKEHIDTDIGITCLKITFGLRYYMDFVEKIKTAKKEIK